MNHKQSLVVADVTKYWSKSADAGTHWESCFRYHSGCLARLLADLEDEE